MSPKRAAAAAASGSASDASVAETDAARHRRRRQSPSPARSRSRSKTPPPNLRPNAAALSSTPTSAGADYAAASDSDDADRGQSPRRSRERSPTPRSDSEADAALLADAVRRVASTKRRRERSPTPRSDSDADGDAADAAGRVPSPRRNRERSPRLYSDSDSDSDDDAAAAAAGRVSSPRRNRDRSPALHSDSDNSGASEDGGREGNVSPPRARRSTRIETSNIKPVSTRLMDGSRRPAGAASSQSRPKRRTKSPALPSVEHNKRLPRVWSPEDEVTILRALIAFRGKKGRLPSSIQDTAKLEGQIRGKLTAKASTTQLSDKIRRLKHKYKLLAIRSKKGREPDLPTDRDRDVYELSKKVWGSVSIDGFNEVGGSHTYENAGDEESNEEQEVEESDEGMESGWDVRYRPNKKPKAIGFQNGNKNATVANGNAFGTGDRSKTSQVVVVVGGGGKDDPEKGMYPYLWEAVEELSKDHPSGKVFRKAFSVLEKSKARAIEEKLRKFRMSEIRQQLRRMDLMKETVTMVLDALEGTG
ncbi:hypothetical protein QOZ80_8AG0633860 [Eleusine coracana subsp. coracana]|nr:hypothetical protein QOZ80_8AG0633860 [Eleusine coracana subsp. coracana]